MYIASSMLFESRCTYIACTFNESRPEVPHRFELLLELSANSAFQHGHAVTIGGRGRLELEPARRVHHPVVLRDPFLDSPRLNYTLLRGRAVAA